MPKSLLVADDSLTIRKAIGMVFSTEDVQVTAVDNGLDAISKARELKPDLVLADAAMPGKSGYEVCEALKADPATRSIPVLLLSGSFEPFDEGRARAAGADGHVPKPFESQGLIDRVKALIGSWEGAPAPAAHAAPAVHTAAPAGIPVRPSAPLAAGPRSSASFASPPSVSAQPAAPFAPRPGQPQPMPGQGLRPSSAPVGAPTPFGRPPAPAPGAAPGRPPAPFGAGPFAPLSSAPATRTPGTGVPVGFPRPPSPSVPPAPLGARPAPLGGAVPPRPGMPPAPGAPAFARPPAAPRVPPAPFGAPVPRPPVAPHAPLPEPQGEELALDPSEMVPAAAARPADGGEALLREAISKASREVIEKVAWEVVPQLAETIIREQLDRLIKEREQQQSSN